MYTPARAGMLWSLPGEGPPPRPDSPAMTPPFRIREATTDADWRRVRAVRQRVFVEEQGCPPEEEWDAHDAPERRGRTVHHLLGLEGPEPVACARWRVIETDAGPAAKLERFAVLPAWRGRGRARQLVARALEDARASGHRRFVLHAQTYAAGLYAAFGFAPAGGTFDEAGIGHVKMTLTDP